MYIVTLVNISYIYGKYIIAYQQIQKEYNYYGLKNIMYYRAKPLKININDALL